MKKAKDQDEMRSEYKREDLCVGVRGKYYEAYNESSNVVVLEPDVAAAFQNAEAVNQALRAMIKFAEQTSSLTSGKIPLAHKPLGGIGQSN